MISATKLALNRNSMFTATEIKQEVGKIRMMRQKLGCDVVFCEGCHTPECKFEDGELKEEV